MELKRTECGGCNLDLMDLGNDSVADFCRENGNEHLGCIKGGVFLYQLRDRRVLKKGSELVVWVNCVYI
jgi:hypothetical protein